MVQPFIIKFLKLFSVTQFVRPPNISPGGITRDATKLKNVTDAQAADQLLKGEEHPPVRYSGETHKGLISYSFI